MCCLMKEASINAKQAGERGISAKSVKKVTEEFASDKRPVSGPDVSSQISQAFFTMTSMHDTMQILSWGRGAFASEARIT
ncbi:hypothetical protein DH86_00004324 [Scytalidium sp. 3C]|nr:hypothetical protein DH86_00004324 [Scytalidium sp. 3C]